jgi:hypothetical protein
MSDQRNDRVKAALQEAFELSRAESRQLLGDVGQRIPEQVRSGALLLGVDRGSARHFLSDPRSDDIGRQFGVSLKSSRLIMNTLMLLEPLCGLGLIVLSFHLLGWWGVVALVALPLVIWASWKSAFVVRSRGSLPKALGGAFLFYGLYAIWERLAAPHLVAALLGFILFGAVVAKYAYPTWRIRRLVTERWELCPTLIESDVVVLRRPTA